MSLERACCNEVHRQESNRVLGNFESKCYPASGGRGMREEVLSLLALLFMGMNVDVSTSDWGNIVYNTTSPTYTAIACGTAI